ncbi:MAG: transposase [Leptolyngbyaceae cyanobacterium]
MPKAYTSSLSRAQFELIEPLLPKAKPGGLYRLNAILSPQIVSDEWIDYWF